MKKKLIALVLALSACFSMTACDVVKDKLSGLPIIGGLINKDSSTEDPAEEYDLDGAKKLLESRVKTTNAESREEYAVPASFQLLGVTYTVEWSVDVDTVKIEKDGDEVYVNVYEASLLFEDTSFVLTAKITAPDGTSIETKMNRIVPKLERYVPAKITEKPVEGTAYKFNVYQAKNKNEVYVNGKMKNTYFFDTSKEYGQGIDIYVEYAEGSTTDFYLYHNVGEGETVEKVYINVVKNGSHINAIYGNPDDYEGTLKTPFYFHDEWETIATDLNGSTYYLGCDGTYDTVEPQNGTGPDYFMGYLVEEVDRLTVEDEDKLAHEVTTLTLAPAYLAGGESASVVTHGSRYPDVKISWEANSEAVSLKRTVLSFNDTDTSASVTLTATLTIGDKTETKNVSFTVVPNKTEDILAAAAAFNSGEAFGNSVELTGVIVSIDDEYDPTYDNVTFTMLVGETRVEGYHMKGDGADVLAPGFTVTCSGKFMNYSGKLEFSSGRIESYEVGEAPEVPDAPTGAEAILNALYALQDGETMTGEFTLTGKITALDNYNNPTIVVEGFEDKPVYCYYLSVTNAVGDIITVTAKGMKNHQGLYEFTNCTLVSSEGGNEGETTSGVTIAAIADANNWTDATVAASFTYGDFTVTVSAEKPNATYGQNTGKYYENGENWRMYQNEVPSIVVSAAEGKYITSVKITYASEKTGVLLYGDTQIASDAVVTASASSITFGVGNTGDATNGQVRITAIDIICADGEGTGTVPPPAGGDNEGGEVTPPAGDPNASKIVTAPAVDTAYNFYLYQGNTNEAYYLSGGMDSYYLATSTTASNAITVYLEAADNGYYLYTYVNNVKTYINMVISDTGFVNGAYEETASTVYTFNTEYNTLVSTITEKNDYYFFGTRNDKDYGTMGPCASQYIASNFLAHFIEANNGGTVTPPAGGEGEGETPVPPTGGDESTSIAAPTKFGDENPYGYAYTFEGTKYYLTDEVNATFYLKTTTDCYKNGFNVYLEQYNNETDKYLLYYYNDEVKTYIEIKHEANSNYWNPNLVTTATEGFYYTWDATNGILITTFASDNSVAFLGRDLSKTFTTIGGANFANVADWEPLKLVDAVEYSAEDMMTIEKELLTLPTNVTGAREIELNTTPTYFKDVTIEWDFLDGQNGGVASIANGKLVITNPNAETTIKVVASLSYGTAGTVKEFLITVAPATDDGVSKVIATFTFGDNGTNTEHVDGKAIDESKEYSADGYTLKLSNVSKVFDNEYDTKGNSCLKMGTSSVVGTLTFTVEETVNKVVIYAAKYKTKNSKLTINGGTAITLSDSSNDGAYEAIEIDTSVTKTITVATVSSNCRVMINTIEFWS